MKNLLKPCILFLLLLPLKIAIAQSTNGNGSPNGRQNWFPNEGNVGIGTRTPAEALEVIGSVKVSQSIYANELEATGLKVTSLNVLQDASIGRNLFVGGNVGINIANPSERLEIGGNLKVSQGIFADQLTVRQFTATDGAVNNSLRVGSKFTVDGVTGLGITAPVERLEVSGNIKVTEGVISNSITSAQGLFSQGLRSAQNIIADGSIGIGTQSPSQKLDVIGNIKSSADVIAVNVRADKGYFKSLESDGNMVINGNIGIGIAPGSDRLTVGGSAYVNGLLTTESLIVKQKLDIKGTFSVAGVLGVGVANPEATLHVNGDGKFEGDLRANKIIVNAIEIAGATTNPDGNPSSVTFGDNLFVNGAIGIGTTKIQGYKLSVDGKIRAGDDIKVYSSAEWSDFVFEKDYNLRSLAEVERYISKHGHLPEIPSAAEVAKDGVNLVQMDAKLLQKIEELTLYVIEMKKENELLKREMKALRASKKN